MGKRRRLLATCLAALPLVLTGCAAIPTTGPVQRGGELRLEREDVGVPFIAEPPRRGASAGDVVRGFLRANADFRNDHETARLYLAPSARQRWDPGVGTTVYERVSDALTVDEAEDGTVVVRATEVARISLEGSYRRTPEGSTVERTFPMERVGGEWRVADLEDGLLLSSLDVQETFRQLALYFLSPFRNTVVPDLVLLPQLPGLSTKLVARLLRGPTGALRGAVGTAFPQGTGLDVQSVPVRDGLAIVRLDETALQADDEAREKMSAQIVWTLKQLGPEIQRVRITAGGEDLVASGVGGVQPRDSWGTFDPDSVPGDPSAYFVSDGAVGRLIEGEFQPVDGTSGTGEPALRTPGISLDARRIAAVSADGTTLLVGRLADDAALEPVASGGDLSRPSWDPLGNLWFIDRAAGHLLLLPNGGTRAIRVGLPRLPAGTPTVVAVSRDGARLALVSGEGRQARAVVGALTGVELAEGDDTDEGAVTVTAVREVMPDVRGVRDVSWSDATRMVVLGSSQGLPAQPLYVTVDGYDIEEVEPQQGLATLAAGPQASPLIGATRSGRLVQFVSGRGWVILGGGVDPAYPG